MPDIGTACLPEKNIAEAKDNPDHLAEENGAWPMMRAGTKL